METPKDICYKDHIKHNLLNTKYKMYCRLCLNNIDNKNAANCLKDETLNHEIIDCVSIEVVLNDNFSKFVCADCITELNNWKKFKQRCHKSQEILHQTLKEHKTCKNEAQESEFQTETDNQIHKSGGKIKILDKTIINVQNSRKGRFLCKECSLDFTTKAYLKSHKRNHKIECEICGIMLLKSNWNQHKNLHGDRFKCTYCLKTCQNASSLRGHIAGVHEKRQDLVCHICGKKFSTKTSMHTHLLVHSEERRHKCHLCSYAARTACNLKNHMHTHTDGTMTFSCQMCDQKCKTVRSLRDHVYRKHKVQKVHECDFCGKKFAHKYVLENHVKTHLGLKPYQCSRCSKAFSRKCHLTDHEKCHDKRQIYTCGICAEEMFSKNAFKKHLCQNVM